MDLDPGSVFPLFQHNTVALYCCKEERYFKVSGEPGTSHPAGAL